ncbi:MAG: glycosyltransferase [Sedimenticola sp.]
MKIIQVGNFDRTHHFHVFYNTDYRVFLGLVRNGHMVIQFSDRDAARESNFLSSKGLGKKSLNEKLINAVKEVRPNLVVLGHADLIDNETLDSIRQLLPSIKIAQYNVDPVFNEKSMKGFRRRIRSVDSSFITTAGEVLKKFSRNNHILSFMPNPVDLAIDTARNFEKVDLEYDIGFSSSGPYRCEVMTWLIKHLPGAKFNWIGNKGSNRLYGAGYMNFLASVKIGVNIPHLDDAKSRPYLYSSDRMAHYLGNGHLVFLDKASCFSDCYSENEVVFFDAKAELLEKLRYFIEHDDERQCIAENGYLKAHGQYNSNLVAKYIIERTFEEKLTECYRWPTDLW